MMAKQLGGVLPDKLHKLHLPPAAGITHL
jgi:hypothetical protein